MRKHTGFTILEVLIVITIIFVLAAALMTAYGVYMDNAERARTSSFLSKVEGALQFYRQDNRFFPEFQGNWSDGGVSNATTNAEMLYQELYLNTEYLVDVIDGSNSSGVGRVDVADTDGDGKLELVDYWGNPLIYIAANFVRDANGKVTAATWPAGAPEQKSGHVWSYELWSAGIDSEFSNLHTGDGDGDNLRASGL